MKNARYNIDENNPQSVLATFTGGGSRVITELFCIATSPEAAKAIVQKMNGGEVINLNDLTDEDITNLRNGYRLLIDRDGKPTVIKP